MKEDIYANLEQLGGSNEIPNSPDNAVLEKVKNPHADAEYLVRFTCPEFTSMCPITSQPDFAHIVIDYVPDESLIESKSLKLYLHSFRNHGGFHEQCTLDIAKKIIETANPKWIRISGYWYPRGGIPIDIFYQSGKPLDNVYIPETGVSNYRGRG